MAYINTELTTTEQFVEWLDSWPRAWEIVERIAQLHSVYGDGVSTFDLDTARGGLCMTLHIMSGYPFDVIARYAIGFAADNYDHGERID